MKVGTDNSIYSLFASLARTKAPSIAEENKDFVEVPPARTPALRSDQELVGDFYARMSKQKLDWADTDQDGKVSRAEYMDGQARLADLNNMPNDPAATERDWAAFDTDGKGWVNEEEIRSGLEKMFPVGVGHLSPAQADRLRYPSA